jgi:hypothetical protein
MRESFKNWIIVFAIIVTVGVIGYFALPGREFDDTEQVLGTDMMDIKYAPYITSVPPVSVMVGETFQYEIIVSDLDTQSEAIQVYLTEKPMWMYLDGNIVEGVPFDQGTYKYVVTVTDGVNSTTQVNYILVQSNE